MITTFSDSDWSNDTKIIELIKKGDVKVFEDVYHHFYNKLCAFCSYYIHDKDEYEEIVQSTMVWLWENRTQLLPHLSLKTLLFTIVKNKALNVLQHEEIKNRVHEELIHKYSDVFNDISLYQNNELIQLYEDALKKMPQEVKEAFLLNRYENMTHRQIAEKYNVSVQTINYRICQALKTFKTALKDYLTTIILLLLQL